MTVIVRAAAAADIEDAYRWYLDKSPDLAAQFLAALRTARTRIEDNPRAYQVIERETRRVRLPRFPYSLFYRIHGDLLVVVACMHASRDPRIWESRA